MRLRSLTNSVFGRARWHADRRMQQFVETRLDLDLDLRPLFNWNTKQVFLSLTASYESPRRVRML